MIDAIIILMYVALCAALGATAFSFWRSLRSREHSWRDNRIGIGVLVLLVLTLLLSYLIGGSVPDMFVTTILVLLMIALLAICLSVVHTKYLH